MLKLSLPNRPLEVDGNYEFLVTEYYNQPKELYVSYNTLFPADAVEVFKQGKEVIIAVDEQALPDYDKKNPVEVMVYPSALE